MSARAALWIFGLICLVAVMLAIAGCATLEPAKPEVVAHATSLPPAQVPIPVACVKASDIPPMPPISIAEIEAASEWQRSVLVRKRFLEWSLYGARTQILLIGCTQVEPEAAR